MKKIKKAVCAAVAALCLCALCTAVPFSEAGAAIVRETAVSDNFDASSLGSVWTADGGAEQRTVASCMRLKDMNIWQPAVILQAYEIGRERPCAVSFDINVKKLTGWLGFFVGARSTSVPFYDANTMWMMSADSVGFWQKDGEMAEIAGEKLSSSPLSSATGENVVTVQYEITFSESNSQGVYFDVDFSFGPQGAPEWKKTYTGVQAETYLGFCSMANLFADVMNFRITEGDDVVFFDDFSSGSVVYPGSSDPSANWRVTHTYTAENVFIGELKRVSFSGVKEGKLFCDYALTNDKRLEELFSITFTVFSDDLTEGNYFGVGFGLNGASDYADAYNMAALKREGGYLVFCRLVNGSETEVASVKIPLSALNFSSADGEEISFAGKSDGSLRIQIAGTEIALHDMIFDGCFAVAVSGASETVSLEIDDFTLETYRYRSADGADMAINFQGVKEFEQFGEIYKEHYYNRNIWYLSGSGIALAPYSSTRNTHYLQLVNASGKVAFGPKKEQYGDFIVRFDVSMLTDGANTPASTAVGIAMGKKTLDAANENSSCVWFSFNGATTAVSGLNVLTETGAASVPCDLNFWESRGVTYNVMMVVFDRTVMVYCKRDTDDISELGILRAKFVDVNTFGYVAFTCNTLDGKTGNCTMTNFSIVNISQN